MVPISESGIVPVLAGRVMASFYCVMYERPEILLERNFTEATMRSRSETCDMSLNGIWETGTFQKYCRSPNESSPHCGGNPMKIMLSVFRFRTGGESRYSPVEVEALAFLHDLESFTMIIL